jgi:exosortase D (VPLPA-CTERM-specific)
MAEAQQVNPEMVCKINKNNNNKGFYVIMESKTNSLSKYYWGAGAILALGVLVIYGQVLIQLMQNLASDEDYSYGLILPFVSVYLVYLKWPQLKRTPWQPSWLGLVVMALALGLFLAGKLAAELYSTRVSFTLFIAGILLLIGGWRILRLLAFPLFLLILMLPLPGIITNNLTFPLQLISSRLSAMFLRALGYPLVLNGNVIDLGSRQLQVAAACSGLRYILSLLALGIIFCYFYQRRLWKGALLLISLVPAAILANALRVAAMGVYPSLQEGFLHGFTGWLIFIFCFGFLGLLNWFLNYMQPPTGAPLVQKPAAPPEAPPSRLPGTYRPFFLAGLAMIVLSGALVYTVGSPPRVPLLQRFDRFPLQIGPWQGQRTYMDPQIFQKTDADSYLEADYTSPERKSVSLYIAHFEKQAKPGGLGHNPGNCMTGIGWKTIASGVRDIAPGLPVNYLVLKRQMLSTPLLVYYWNIQQGHWLALGGHQERLLKFITIINAIRSHRSDWALIRLITPINHNINEANKRLTAFSHLLIPILPKFISSSFQYNTKNLTSTFGSIHKKPKYATNK